jgi:hypothetical protein
MQPQGSSALSVGWFTAYMTFDVPTDTILPYYTHVWFTSSNPDDFVIATLLNSTFLEYTDGTFINADLENHGIGDDVWNVWMTYDNREFTAIEELDYSPSGTFMTRLHSHLSSYSLPLHTVQFGLRVNRLNSTAKPSNAKHYIVVFQVRIIMGGAS